MAGNPALVIDGCLEWQRIGLAPPKIVTDATERLFQRPGHRSSNGWMTAPRTADPTPSRQPASYSHRGKRGATNVTLSPGAATPSRMRWLTVVSPGNEPTAASAASAAWS